MAENNRYISILKKRNDMCRSEQMEEEYTIEYRKERIKDIVDRTNENCNTISVINEFVRKRFDISGEKVKEKL